MRLTGIQLLRFFAATAVVLFHSAAAVQSYYPLAAPTALAWVSSAGNLGVDLFFVISGFIIYYSTASRPFDLRDFLWRRGRRLVPIYWVYTALFVALTLVLPFALRTEGGVGIAQLTASAFFVSFAISPFPVVYVGWSLEYEVLFYLLVAATLSVFRGGWPGLVTLLLALVALGRLLSPHELGPIVAFVTSPLLLQFAIGVLIGLAARGNWPKWPVWVALLTTVALIAYRNPLDRVLIGGGAAALLVCGAVFWERAGGFGQWSKLPQLLGDASYSIYLIQVFSIPPVFRLLVLGAPTLPADIAILVATVTTLAAGLVAYLSVERPLLALLGSHRTARMQAAE